MPIQEIMDKRVVNIQYL